MRKASIPRVRFFFLESRPNLKSRTRLKSFIDSIFKKEKKILGSINFIFTNDKIVRKINKEYLNHDFNTDIITFDLSEKKNAITAEVYISCDRVKENAQIHKTSLEKELHRVVFHGSLHLCGYNDKTSKESNQMRNKEDLYLLKYFA